VTGIEPCSTERGISEYPAPFRVILKAGSRKDSAFSVPLPLRRLMEAGRC
jgi:hypothetical protein